MCYPVADSGSSDESTHGEVADHSVSNNVLQPLPGQSSRPSGQSSRPSSRQGQKYTSAATAATAAAAATPPVIGYRDGVLPSRKVRHLNISFLLFLLSVSFGWGNGIY